MKNQKEMEDTGKDQTDRDGRYRQRSEMEDR